MAKDILSALNNPVADHSKNVFDLSQTHTYSLPIGMVGILDYVHTVPDATYRLKFDELVHTKPFVTDPFLRLKKHIDVWFVPFSSIWHGWENFLSQSAEKQSSYMKLPNNVPYFSLADIIAYLNEARNNPTTYTDSQGYPQYQSMKRFLDAIGIGTFTDRFLTEYNNNPSDYYTDNHTKFNLWNACAYHKIWNFAYRDSHHTNPINARYYNLDFLDTSTFAGANICDLISEDRADFLRNLFTYRYRKCRGDVFHSAQASRQFGAVSSMSFNAVSIINTQPNGTGTNAAVYTRGNDGKLYQGTNVSDKWSIPSAFDVYAMKRAEMLQAYNEQLGRAGQSVRHRAKAIYGVEPRSIAKDDPVLVGATSFDIRSNQVTATGESSVGGRDVSLGDIAGKGIGFTGENFMEFKSTEYGVLMAVTYCLPDLSYSTLGYDKLNSYLERFDYFTPQLMNLGLEEVVQGNLAQYGHGVNNTVTFYPDDELNEVIGYLPRYWPYKIRYDKAHLGFGADQSVLSTWVATHRGKSLLDVDHVDYYVDPADYDPLFAESFDGSVLTDSFVCNCRVNCQAVLPMTELGLVNW